MKDTFQHIRHTIRRDPNYISKVALNGLHQTEKARGKDQRKLRILTTEFKNTGKTCGEMERIAKDHGYRRSLVTALCATKHG